MARVRSVVVGFQSSDGKIEKTQVIIPAEWITEERDALEEIQSNKKLRTKLAVRPGVALWAEISEPFEETLPETPPKDPWVL